MSIDALEFRDYCTAALAVFAALNLWLGLKNYRDNKKHRESEGSYRKRLVSGSCCAENITDNFVGTKTYFHICNRDDRDITITDIAWGEKYFPSYTWSADGTVKLKGSEERSLPLELKPSGYIEYVFDPEELYRKYFEGKNLNFLSKAGLLTRLRLEIQLSTGERVHVHLKSFLMRYLYKKATRSEFKREIGQLVMRF